MNAATIFHRSGGTVTAINTIGHETYKGVANWFFRGDVEWRDGSKSTDIEIAPHMLCWTEEAPAGEARIRDLIKQLNDYLAETGEWLDKPKHMRDGRVVNWVSPATSGFRRVQP